jgi:hypothetical protein
VPDHILGGLDRYRNRGSALLVYKLMPQKHTGVFS